MNSRQRVATALNHQEPDQVPIDLGSTENTTITRIAYQNLRDTLGLEKDPDPFIINRQMDAVYPKEDLLERYQVDFRPVRPSPTWESKTREMSDDSFYDELGIRWKHAGNYYDMVEHPMRDFSLDEILNTQWPDPHEAGRMAGIRAHAQDFYTNTAKALVVGHITWGPFELGCALRGYDQFLIDFYENPLLVDTLLDKNLELAINFWDAYLTEVGEFVQVAAQGDDLGMQIGPMISPNMYRQYIKPRHKQLFDFIRSKTNARIYLHSCGSVFDLIPDFIDAGVEILNPVQMTAAKMDLQNLKKTFGEALTFWGGGVDTQQMLPHGDIPEIKDHVSRIFDIMAPGGGFVFVPVHNIQANVAPERIHAVYETALAKRSYHG